MTDQDPNLGGEDDADLTAAEHVLGLLDGEARERAAARLRADPSFQADVEDWERRLAPLANAVAPVSPSEQLWERIAETIGPSTVVAFPLRTRPWERVGFWRAATVASMAAAAACVALVILRPAPGPPAATGPVLVATLTEANGKALFVATLDRSRRGMTVVPVGAPGGNDRSPELWIIPAGGKPRPVGMLNAVQARLIPASAAVLSIADTRAVLAVSLEPAGGSPTGAPTGPVIATGAFKAL
jgi:anti-sigma-K factor RskA